MVRRVRAAGTPSAPACSLLLAGRPPGAGAGGQLGDRRTPGMVRIRQEMDTALNSAGGKGTDWRARIRPLLALEGGLDCPWP